MLVRIMYIVSFDCSYIMCSYWVGLPLTLNAASTRLGIELNSSINVSY